MYGHDMDVIMIVFKTMAYLELEHMRVWSRSASGFSWWTQAEGAPGIVQHISSETIVSLFLVRTSSSPNASRKKVSLN